jgi:subtilisin family serine protease
MKRNLIYIWAGGILVTLLLFQNFSSHPPYQDLNHWHTPTALEIDLAKKSLKEKNQLVIKFKPDRANFAVDVALNSLIQKKKNLSQYKAPQALLLERMLNRRITGIAPLHRYAVVENNPEPEEQIYQARKAQLTQKLIVKDSSEAKRLASLLDGMANTYLLTAEGETARLKEDLGKEDAILEVAEEEPIFLNYDKPNDFYYTTSNSWGQTYQDLWNLTKIGVEPAWQITRGAGVTVAVVDTGVDYTHPDIKNNILINTADPTDNGVDDDKNGYIDDVYGWNYYAQSKDVRDFIGHGTHVAGIIAAQGNNKIGIVGVAPEAKILPVKIFGDSFASDLAGAKAITYSVNRGAKVINNSWGCRCKLNFYLADAIEYATSKGALVVFAAGNSSSDVSTSPLLNLPEVLVVGSSTVENQLADGSNYGYAIDVVAPGDGVLSLRSQQIQGDLDSWRNRVGNDYLVLGGTSMSAPQVSGVATLLFSRFPQANPYSVKDLIKMSAQDILLPGYDKFSGAGLVNAAKALSTRVPVVRYSVDSPKSADVFQTSAPVNIQGSAYGPDFYAYEVFVGKGVSPSSWQRIKLNFNPMTSGTLASWPTEGKENGIYTFFLQVTLKDLTWVRKYFYLIFDSNEHKLLSEEEGLAGPPSADGSLVAWNAISLAVYDLVSKTLIHYDSTASNPNVYQGKVMFQTYQNIMKLYDNSTRTISNLFTTNQIATALQFNSEAMAWCSKGSFNIKRKSETMPTSYYSDFGCQLSLSNRYAAWMRALLNGDKLTFKNLITNVDTEIVSGPNHSQSNVVVSGDNIFWLQGNFWDESTPADEIKTYNVLTKQISTVMQDFNRLGRDLTISGSRLVYVHAEGGYKYLWMLNLSTWVKTQLTFTPSLISNPFLVGNQLYYNDHINGKSFVFSMSVP